jgi:hypothetical protein
VIPRNFKAIRKLQNFAAKIDIAFASSLPLPSQPQPHLSPSQNNIREAIQPGHVLLGRIANIVASVARQQRRPPAAVHPRTRAFFAGAVSATGSISIWGSRRDLDSFLDSFHLIIAAAPFHHSLFVEPSVIA